MAYLKITNRIECYLVGALLLSVFIIHSALPPTSHAAFTTNITPGGTLPTPTTVTPAGNIFNINGGTQLGNNLFHSFQFFNLGTGDIASFNGPSTVANILSRVLGGQSMIDGTLRTTIPGANLYLINPAGVLFGPNAQLDIGHSISSPGSFHVSTADYLQLGTPGQSNAGVFSANPLVADVLTSAPVTAFGFLSSNPAGITIQGSALLVDPGQSISVVGGDITITGGTLTAPSGQINLVSVTSPGEVLLPTFQTAPNVNGDTFTAMGTINISQGSSLDVSGDPGGTMLIRGGQFTLDNSTIAADTTGATSHGAAPAVDINVTGDVTITKNGGGPAISAQSQGAGDAGEVRISANNFTANYQLYFDPVLSTDFFALIETRGSGAGKAGNVTITASNKIDVQGSPAGSDFFIDSSNSDVGPAGDIAITGSQVHLLHVLINGGGFNFFVNTGSGHAANIQLTADDLRLDQSFIESVAGQGGDVTITAKTLNTSNIGIINAGLSDRGGDVSIQAESVVMDFNSTILTGTSGSGRGGNVNVIVKSLDLLQGSQIGSETFGSGPSGQVTVTATDRVTISGDSGGSPGGIFTSSFSNGNAGPVFVTTPTLVLMGGGRINSGTISDGHGGDVTIVADNIVISGQQPSFFPDFQFSVTAGTPTASSIFTGTVGINPGASDSTCLVRCGGAGNVMITTGALTVADGGTIYSGTLNQGTGGNVTINAAEAINLSGIAGNGAHTSILSTTQDTTPGAGAGGNIKLGAGQVRLSDGATISAQSTGTGPAGNILIGKDAPVDALVMQSSSITTESAQNGGGSIEIHAGRLAQLTDSKITTSVHGGGGDAGNITIDPQFVILQGSQILAQAFGGNGGNISIVASVFFADPTSVVDASSAKGISGTVDIQAPVTNLSGTLAPLPTEIVQAAALLHARCAARLEGGTSSSFVVAGRDGLPLEPGGFLPSPLFVESMGGARLAGYINLPDLQVGRTFGEPDLALASLVIGCAS